MPKFARRAWDIFEFVKKKKLNRLHEKKSVPVLLGRRTLVFFQGRGFRCHQSRIARDN
jgi:hypothetical protein